MSTGYTADVADGKITDFKTFALRCARAFGACVMQREDPIDIPPKMRDESDYYLKSLSSAEAELAELITLTSDACLSRADKEFEESMKDYRNSVKEHALTKERYQSMLVKVQNWTPPTFEHRELKKFMLEQIQESIKFDSYDPPRPKRLDAEAWRAHKIEQLHGNIVYYSEQAAKEKERCETGNKWLTDLVNSLKGDPAK